LVPDQDEETELFEFEKRGLGIFRKLSPSAQLLFIKHGEDLMAYEQKQDMEKGINLVHDQERA
jgi:hypothetical protein